MSDHSIKPGDPHKKPEKETVPQPSFYPVIAGSQALNYVRHDIPAGELKDLCPTAGNTEVQ